MVCPLIDVCDSFVTLKHYREVCESQKQYTTCSTYISLSNETHKPKFWRAKLQETVAQTSKQSP